MLAHETSHELSFIFYQNKMNELEQQKIALTKELERIQEKIDYCNLYQIKYGNDEFKDIINKRDRIRRLIEDIKTEMEKQTLSI